MDEAGVLASSLARPRRGIPATRYAMEIDTNGSKEYCEQKEDEMLSDDSDSENNDAIDVHGICKESISEKKKENSNGKANSTKHEDKNGDEKDGEGLTETVSEKDGKVDGHGGTEVTSEISQVTKKKTRKRKLVKDKVDDKENIVTKSRKTAASNSKEKKRACETKAKKSNKSKPKDKGSKSYEQYDDENDTSFILKVGDQPLRDIPLNVRKLSEGSNNDWNDNLLESHQEENKNYTIVSGDEAETCTVDEITITTTESDKQHSKGTNSKCPVYHYTDGKKALEDLKINNLKHEFNKELQDQKISYDNLSAEVKSLSKAVEQSQKTLSSILLKLLNPHATIPTGFNATHTNIAQPPSGINNTNWESTGSTDVVPPSQEGQVVTPNCLVNSTQESQVVTPSHRVNNNQESQVVTTSHRVNNNQESQVITPSSQVNNNQESQVITPSSQVNNNQESQEVALSHHVNNNKESPVVTPGRSLNTSEVSASQVITISHPVDSLHVTPAINSANTPLVSVFSDGPELLNSSSNGTCLSSNEITMIYRKSHSRRNFSSKLVCRLFDENTRKTSNVAGKVGKAQLNPLIIDYVKSLAFQFFPLHPHEKKGKAWADCILTIDEKNRRLNNKPTKQQLVPLE